MTPSRRANIAVICINYENRPEAERFLAQWEARPNDLDSSAIELLLVDNSEKDQLPTSFHRPEASTVLLQVGKNLGYLGGFQFGWDYLKSQGPLPEWVILSNPDIKYANDFFAELLKLSNLGPQVIAPRVLSSRSNQDHNPFMRLRPATSRMWIYRMLFAWHYSFVFYDFVSQVKKVILHGYGRPPDSNSSLGIAKIYAPHGSLIVFNRAALERLQSVADAPFLFCEEIYLAERCQQLAIETTYQPKLVAVHRESTTIGLIPSRKISRFKAHANRLVYDRYFAGQSRGKAL